MDNRTPEQRASRELAEAAFADPETRERFKIMIKDTSARDLTRDDFSWLSSEARPQRQEFSRFRSLTQMLLRVPKDEVRGHRPKS